MYYLFGILLFLYLGFLSAWSIALAARFSSRIMQLLSAFFTSTIQLTLGSLILFGLWQIEYASTMKRGFLVPLAFMLVSNALLLIVLLACGLWRKDRLPNARHWPQGRVLLAALTFAFLAAITYGTIDHSIKQFLLGENTLAVKRLREIYDRNISEAQNAANIYREIGPLLESKPVPKAYIDWIAQLPRPVDAAVFSDPAVLAYHEQVEPLLEKGRQAAELPTFKCMRFVYDSPITSTLVNPRDDALSHARNIASGWDFSARLKMSQGNVAGAIREVAAMRLLSKQLAQEPDVLNHSVAFEVGQKGEMIIAELTQRYELKESDLALLPKHLILKPQAMELAMEAREQEAVRMVIASHLDYRMVLTNGYGVQGVLPQAAVEIALSLLRVLRAQEDIGNLRHLMEENREPLSLPSWKMIAEADRISRPAHLMHFGPLARPYIPSFRLYWQTAICSNATAVVGQAGIAAYRYRLQHGDFPPSLEVLQTFDPTLDLVDPFSGQSLKMLRKDDALIIYSIGLDLQDNGGAEPTYKNKKLAGDILLRLTLPK